MTMKRILFVLLVALPLGWVSCEKDIEFKGELMAPMLVVNGFLTPDSAVSVEISESRFMLGGEVVGAPPVVEDATVGLRVNGEWKEQLSHAGNGRYRGTYFPVSGDRIRVEAKADGFEEVWGETVIPRKPNVVITDSVSAVNTSMGVSYGNIELWQKNWTARLQLALKDPAGEENYYFVKGQKFYRLEDGRVLPLFVDLGISELLGQIDPDHANFLEEELFGGYSHMVENLFTDRFVDGKELLFDFSFSEQIDQKVYENGVEKEEPKREAEVELRIEFAAMSRGMYQYVVSASKSNATDGNILVEPVPVYSNITNGAGVLESYVPFRVSFRYKKKYDANSVDPRYPFW